MWLICLSTETLMCGNWNWRSHQENRAEQTWTWRQSKCKSGPSLGQSVPRGGNIIVVSQWEALPGSVLCRFKWITVLWEAGKSLPGLLKWTWLQQMLLGHVGILEGAGMKYFNSHISVHWACRNYLEINARDCTPGEQLKALSFPYGERKFPKTDTGFGREVSSVLTFLHMPNPGFGRLPVSGWTFRFCPMFSVT